MDSVIIKRNVILRAVVTEGLRNDLGEELQNAADEIDRRLETVDQQTKAYLSELQRTDLQQAMAVRKRIEAEKRAHQDQRDALLERKAMVAELKDGVEVVRGTLESYVEIKVGDSLAEVLGGVEIVTRDDEVIELRQRTILDEIEDDNVVSIIESAGPRIETP